MALRAFHDNPSIGGFGGESTPLLSVQDLLWSRNRKNTTKDHGKASSSSNHPSRPINHGSDGSGDAFCQIVKELVDNAVDACSSNETKKRIRVEIRPYSDPDIIDGNEQQDRRTLNETLVDDSRNEILQISVLDNGVGMDNIQNCVNAFHSSKRLGIDGDDSKEAELQTSGRYGIGLTLCLLHAQRLIPNSYACITSTTRESKHRTRAFFVVDTLGDSIECHREEVIDKRDPVESGTCVSLLVPGGAQAKLAWPRLADYFARFRLCPDLHFGLEVLAPTLSMVPIFIRPHVPVDSDCLIVQTKDATEEVSIPDSPIDDGRGRGTSCTEMSFDSWEDLSEETICNDCHGRDASSATLDKLMVDHTSTKRCGRNKAGSDCQSLFRAATAFWPHRNVHFKNVARSVQNIRTKKPTDSQSADRALARRASPDLMQLEVNVIVCPRGEGQGRNGNDSSIRSSSSMGGDSKSSDTNDENDHEAVTARLQLVRLVNGTPLLDGVEAHACGLVHGVSNKAVWGQFGLTISQRGTMIPGQEQGWTPTFDLQDSAQITPFLQKNGSKHRPLSSFNKADTCGRHKADKTKMIQESLHPAHLRLGQVLVVVRIRAAPTSLPLPTLCKGRLPVNHRPIDTALQLGLRECLRSLQTTNPSILLSSKHLRSVERDVRYVPAISFAVSRIACKSPNDTLRKRGLLIFNASTFRAHSAGHNHMKWNQSRHGKVLSARASAIRPPGKEDNFEILLSSALEERLRIAIEATARIGTTSRRHKRRKNDKNMENSVMFSDLDESDSQVGKRHRNRTSSLPSPAPARPKHQLASICELSVSEESKSNTPRKLSCSASCLQLAPPTTSPESFAKSHLDSILSTTDGCHMSVRSSRASVSEPLQIKNSETLSASLGKESVSADNDRDISASSSSADEIDLDSIEIGDVQVPMRNIVVEMGQSGDGMEESDDDLDGDWW